MDSILRRTLASLRVTFTLDGVPTDPAGDAATVTITRADGSVLVEGDVATRITVGEFGYTLDSDQTAAVDILTADWTAALAGTPQTLTTRAQIVGGYYFAAKEFKDKYPDDQKVQGLSFNQIAAARAKAEEIIERACHVAFVPRPKALTLSGQGESVLALPLYMIRRVIYAAVDGQAQDISQCIVGPGGIYRRTPPFPLGVRNTELVLEHGYDQPSDWLKDACMTLAFHRAIKGPVEDRAVSVPAGDAGGTITLLTPGVGGAVTGLPDVDEAIAEHALPDPLSVGQFSTTGFAYGF